MKKEVRMKKCLTKHVIVPTQNKIQKGEFLLAFFYACRKNLQ
jgi:hypothetical protein